jgi:endonuclease YncB( thermonuclease family)
VRTSGKVASAFAGLVVVAAVLPHHDSGSKTPTAGRQTPESATLTSPAPAHRPEQVVALSRPASAPLLRAAPGGDGDSWHDTAGREYRLGLVNAPEYNQCFGSAATAKRKALTAAGFRAKVYTRDTYGRSVSVITTAGGINVNVYLARHGFADDKYFQQFRNENRSLAGQLDVAFAAAKAEHAGLWGACAKPAQPHGFVAAPAPKPAAPAAPAASGCHPDYVTCIPVKGDGSGSGAANDLDCGDIRQVVTLRQAGVDPYRLDADGDGTGCDSYA